MNAPVSQPLAKDTAPIGFAEFVALIASLLALGALGIDSMLPALPAMGTSLGVESENARQYIITAFVIGFGLAQLVHGPLSDRFGRRTTLLVSLAAYAIANVLCAISASFALLLAARACGGIAIAATRVSTVAMVRDCYSGRAMARVMSIAFIVFMIVPVLAPSFGWFVLLFGNWRAIFWTIAVVSIGVFAWYYLRMPETLHEEDRHPIDAARIVDGWKVTLGDRWSLGYTLASAALLGALYGYLNSIQQIMADVFHRPALLVVIFATTAATMALANFFNARLVMRLGTRRISHGALCVLIVSSALHLALALAGVETLLTFAVLQAITMGCFGLATSNFSAMAMENMGHIAGTASSVQGFASVTFGAAIGAVIGQAFDGSTAPLTGGFLLMGVAALASVFVTERGRLFQPVHPDTP
ncbi:MFS transporter [Sphingomonas sp. EC-HK361]|uniref:multidrug effflux MFS transporter n=1 Tax=Sphingomonas sp. EC-HK361 TaxID=2038397 RepID=UPI0012514A27|nr:multidrug effflux MFS transporter [Sphingomonas sp. EC-HK361]VVT02171.1 MFS transporter [Sphingomonas sp. EC-HK361]